MSFKRIAAMCGIALLATSAVCAKMENIVKNSQTYTGRPDGVAIAFTKSGGRDNSFATGSGGPGSAAANERPTARYVSGTMVCEEALENGRLIGVYWSATGQVQRENVTARLPGLDSLAMPLNVFEMDIDGQSLHNRWDWVGAYERKSAKAGTVEAVVELKHQVRPVRLKVVTRLDGSSVLVRWLEITNTGTVPSALSRVSPWSGRLWNTDPNWRSPSLPTASYSLGYQPGDKPSLEGDFTWIKLPQECFSIERTQGRTFGPPYFILKNEWSSETCFMALEWSGNFRAEFVNRPNESLFFRLGPLGPAPLRLIEPGETICSPAVHLGMMHCGTDAAIGNWHDHIRRSVLPPRPEGKEMYTVAGRVVEEPGEWILREVDIAAEMGVEAFMVDAGWYGEKFSTWWSQRGDWVEGNWLPGGMAGIREYVHKKGLLFGLWIEAEAISPASKLYKDHPDWVLTTDDKREIPLALNLAKPEVAKFVEDSVVGIIRDFKLDFFKLDYNMSVLEGGQNLRDGYAEHEWWRHMDVLHSIFDKVRYEYPSVALENCSSGGGRNDLSMLSRFHYACESDFSTFPESIRAINTLTLFLPPEAICYYHNHSHFAHQTADLDTHLRVTLFATPIFCGFGGQDADRSTAYFARTRKYIEMAKGFCREVMSNRARVYHHTPYIGVKSPADWCVLEYGLDDHKKGYVGVFKINPSGPDEYVLHPSGVDRSLNYEVTFDNTGEKVQVSGLELANSGLRIRLESGLTSELILYMAR
ncbi:MAG: glycoside hydrolase family 36 protein [Armatimonadota bacterium]